MSQTYKIIADEGQFREFIDWLPVLGPNELFYCALLSRKKYALDGEVHPNVKTDRTQLRRFLADKEDLFNRTKQGESPLGSYTQKDYEVTQDTLAMYINTNPRDTFKATWATAKKLLQVIETKKPTINPASEANSIIQKTVGTKHTVSFDLDDKSIPVEYLVELCDGFCDIIETRGGYHVHVLLKHAKDISNKKWHESFRLLPNCDASGDKMTPAVGCWQGGFIPKFVYRYGINQ